MSGILNTIASRAFPVGNFQNIKANAPNQINYNINATRDLVKNQPFNPLAPAMSATLSLPYDTFQGIGRAFEGVRSEPGILDYDNIPNDISFADIGKSIAAENPLDSLLSRTYGATLGLGDKLTGYGKGLASLFGSNAMADTNIQDYMSDQSINKPENLGFIEEAPQVKGMSYEQMVDLGLMGPDQDVGMTVADLQNRRSKTGIFNNPVTRSLGTAFNFARGSIPGMLMSGLGSIFNRDPNAPSYQTRSPNINYSNLNTNNLNDFYDNNPNSPTFGTTRFDRAKPGSFGSFRTLTDYFNRDKTITNPTKAIEKENSPGGGSGGGGFNSDNSSGYDGGNFCFDPSTLIQMADGSTKEIKNIQLGDATKGGEVTGVFQFKASDEIHNYKGVIVAGSHYVKEDGEFIMVKDSPLSIKIDKIPVVYSLDTTGRRIFINDIEFADYNGDGVAKNFLTNAGVNLSGFDKEVLRQVEQRLI